MSGRPIGVRNVPDPAMTFTEIGERLGISRKMAFLHYSRGMYKIRRRPENQEVLERVSRNLNTSEQKILAIIHNQYPAEIDKETLADLAGYAVSGGGFNNYLGHLRTLGLIEGKGAVKCSEYLFVE